MRLLDPGAPGPWPTTARFECADGAQGHVLGSYEMTPLASASARLLGEFYRHQSFWKLRVLDVPTTLTDLAALHHCPLPQAQPEPPQEAPQPANPSCRRGEKRLLFENPEPLLLTIAWPEGSDLRGGVFARHETDGADL